MSHGEPKPNREQPNREQPNREQWTIDAASKIKLRELGYTPDPAGVRQFKKDYNGIAGGTGVHRLHVSDVVNDATQRAIAWVHRAGVQTWRRQLQLLDVRRNARAGKRGT